MKKKVLVLTDDLPWGHRSIARAIFGFLKDNEEKSNYQVELREIKANIGMAGDLYTFAYRYIPKTNKLIHRISQRKVVRELLEEVSVVNLPRLKREVERLKPDLVICTYFLHSHSLARWRKKTGQKFKLWAVVPDPWTINPVSFIEGADLNIVYDKTALEEGIKYGIDRDKMVATGWWTREAMYKKYDYKEVRKKLGFMDDRPVIFVGGGSLGTNSLPRLLPTMLMIDKKVGFVINTGIDKVAFNLVEQYQKMFKRLRKDSPVQIFHMGWIENMTEVLSACDMVFGKAGPNFLFDVMAVKKPFVAMTHIGGQEDGNVELIKKKKLGWVKEKNGEISTFLIEYLKRPKYFENKYKEHIKKESDENQKTLPKILEMVNEELF